MKISFIAIVFNEESSIKSLLESVFSQSQVPDEIIIVDGGSTDKTVLEISNFKIPTGAKIKLIFKKGNRSVGRNEAIKNASNEIIVCSDAGCILEKNWVKDITDPFKDPKIDVVAGYYRGIGKTVFEKCLIPYVLVMPDRVNVDNFLPATRSMAFKKSVWKEVGGFDEKLSHNEDYVFAKKLKKINANIIFEKKAIVYWTPRSNIKDAFVMFYRFALGDAQAKIFRPKVIFIFLRYILGFFILSLFFADKFISLNLLLILISVYIIWSIAKNLKYVWEISALYYFPLIQVISDFAVMLGTICSLLSF